MTHFVEQLRNSLVELSQQPWPEYTVPGVWVGLASPTTFPSAPAYFMHQLSVIDSLERGFPRAEWKIEKACVYNAMVRHVTSYQHGAASAESGWKSTGTFIKMLALLPYLRRMGVDTISLLPITEVGVIGNKGTLGSPYAVRHPLHISEQLTEPNIPLSVDDQARAFIECCHALGIKVVLELVLRTASIDSELVAHHPEWFYWVDELIYQSDSMASAPKYSATALTTMREKVEQGRLDDLPEPDQEYCDMFTPPPFRVEMDSKGWKGLGAKNNVMRIPGAFADWPADDVQPPWSDVTYLKLYDHPHYRYMAYNTIRMYERKLDVDEYRVEGLWNTIVNIIPYFVRQLNIDGAMIDMGHALPGELRKRLISTAKKSKPGFLLFEENFSLSTSSANSGYDAVIGYLPFDSSNAEALERFVQRVANSDIPIRYFATPESHNTPRIATSSSSLMGAAVWIFLRCLPKSLGFIHAGIELCETRPVNTGLGFTEEQNKKYSPQTLPLFSDVPLPWEHSNQQIHFAAQHKKLSLLNVWKVLQDDDEIIPLPLSKGTLGYIRFNKSKGRGLMCLLNTTEKNLTYSAQIPVQFTSLVFAADSGVTLNECTFSLNVEKESVLVVVVWGVQTQSPLPAL
ncbi:MAG: alpha-amylase [Ignavibacteria bacterium]|nr:alpha-amylase [Ignavibacteria bacterium]